MTSDATALLLSCSPVEDIKATNLGDPRLNQRHLQIMEKMVWAPSASVPETFKNDAQLQAYYRFTDNPRFTHDDLLEPHFQATAQRAQQLERVLVIHDTTRIRFDVHNDFERENLCRFAKNSQGFQWHVSLICAFDTTRAPLGLIASLPYVHQSQTAEEAQEFWRARGGLFENEMERWLESVEHAESRLESCTQVVHVMDREGDCFELMFALQANSYDSIIRACYDRCLLKADPGAQAQRLHQALEQAPWLGERTIELSMRTASQASKTHPERRQRRAQVQVRMVRVNLARPANVSSCEGMRQQVKCWAVQMQELNPPEGEPAANWLLLTSLPVESEEQAWHIVDGYRARWLIEEFNKAFKTGCAVSKSQQRSAQALLKVVALAAPVAWYLLVLRHLAEHAPKVKAEQVVSKLELKMLKQLKPKLIGRSPKVADVMQALASLGGHKKGNGQPGWLTIERGRRHLAEQVAGARLFMRMTGTCDES